MRTNYRKQIAKSDDPANLVTSERGQISVLFLFGLIPLIFLMALILNTAKQTTKKIEMQGAADAAVLSGAVWEARGMNLIVLNNNSMSEVLSLMIMVRSMRKTAELMPRLCAPMAVPPFTPLYTVAVEGSIEMMFIYEPIDTFLNARNVGAGWTILSILDKFNQAIRSIIPAISFFQTYNYAVENQAALSLLMTSKSFSFTSLSEMLNEKRKFEGLTKDIRNFASAAILPILPIARGRPQLVAIRADDCQLKFFKAFAAIELAIHYKLILVPVAYLLFDFIASANVKHLSGRDSRSLLATFVNLIRKAVIGALNKIPFIGNILSKVFSRVLNRVMSVVMRILEEILLQPLSWSDTQDQPMPMVLSDNPVRGITIKDEEDVNLKEVRKYLQFLSLTFDKRDPSPIGKDKFINESPKFLPNTQFTFAQAEVYNPTKWSMFSQDWRAKLSKATVFDEKFTDWSFVNSH